MEGTKRSSACVYGGPCKQADASRLRWNGYRRDFHHVMTSEAEWSYEAQGCAGWLQSGPQRDADCWEIRDPPYSSPPLEEKVDETRSWGIRRKEPRRWPSGPSCARRAVPEGGSPAGAVGVSPKKTPHRSTAELRELIEPDHDGLPVHEQCQLFGLNRSTLFYRPQPADTETDTLMRRIDELHTAHITWESRKIRDALRMAGWRVNRMRIQRLKRLMALRVVFPPATSSAVATGAWGLSVFAPWIVGRSTALCVLSRSDQYSSCRWIRVSHRHHWLLFAKSTELGSEPRDG